MISLIFIHVLPPMKCQLVANYSCWFVNVKVFVCNYFILCSPVPEQLEDNVTLFWYLGVIQPGLSVPIAVPVQNTDMTAQYWPSRLQWQWWWCRTLLVLHAYEIHYSSSAGTGGKCCNLTILHIAHGLHLHIFNHF